MIAELFYPKELKGIIADLRAKDDLNEEALNTLDMNFRVICGTFLAVGVIAYLCWGHFYLTIIGGVSASTIIARHSMLHTVCNVVIPYTIGQEVRGEIRKKYSNYVQGILRVLYYFKYNGRNMKGEAMCHDNVEWSNVSAGTAIIFVNPQNVEHHALFLPQKFKNFCMDIRRVNQYLSEKEI